ncbi:RNA-directed DNA polymerase from transposon X-element, partial [Brachionus plicatilis]
SYICFIANFNQALRPFLGETIQTKEDIDKLTRQLESTITSTINGAKTTYSVKSYQTQVLPRNIVTLIKEKRKLQRHLLEDRSAETVRRINKLSEQIKKQVAENKQNKWREFCTGLNLHKTSDTVLWRKISSIENSNTLKPPRCPLLKVQEQLVTTPNEVANIFAEQLKQTFQPTNEPEFNETFKATVESATKQIFENPPNGHQLGKRKLDIILQGKRIKHDNKPKLLGLKLDKNLTFYDHIKEINAR